LFATQDSFSANDARLGIDLTTQYIDGDDMRAMWIRILVTQAYVDVCPVVATKEKS
jgi:hypothetical protein